MKIFLIKDESGTVLHTVRLPGDGKIIVEEEDNSVEVSFIPNSKNPFYEFLNGRCIGKFAAKAFWLSNKYNWELRKESDNQLLLVPTKK